MKSIGKKLACTALCALMAIPFAACGGGDNGGTIIGGGDNPGGGDKTTIRIAVYAAGYGTGWIEEACRLYAEDHPELKFSIEATPQMFDTNKTRLETNTCKSDVVLIANANYASLVARGVLEELSDVYDAVIPGTEVTVKSTIPAIQYDYRVRDGKVYGMPWQDAYSSGFIYNKKMFREHGWEVPTTMKEFFDLCDKITEDEPNVAPVVFGGGQQNGYVPSFFNQWFVEYYGYEYINNTFEKYESPQIYSDTLEGRQKVYETAAKLVKGTTKSGKPIAKAGSNSYKAQAAQREFVQGKAAMNVCGNWFPTEMKSYLKGQYANFEYGYMPVPHINDDKMTGVIPGTADTRVDSSKVRYSLDGNILCVPKSSQHKDIAKDFLVSMYTQESYQTFVEQNNGVLRPTNVAIDSSKLNDFAKASYDYYYAGKEANQYVYECSRSPMALNGYLALLISQNGNTPGNLINAKSYEDALSVAATAAADDYTRALEFWDASKNQWHSNYLGVE